MMELCGTPAVVYVHGESVAIPRESRTARVVNSSVRAGGGGGGGVVYRCTGTFGVLGIANARARAHDTCARV
jgi:hypothetical protein